jgi:hypothetical protein
MMITQENTEVDMISAQTERFTQETLLRDTEFGEFSQQPPIFI